MHILDSRTVLYPWHHELDDAFRKLKAEQASALKEFHEVRLTTLLPHVQLYNFFI